MPGGFVPVVPKPGVGRGGYSDVPKRRCYMPTCPKPQFRGPGLGGDCPSMSSWGQDPGLSQWGVPYLTAILSMSPGSAVETRGGGACFLPFTLYDPAWPLVSTQ